MLKVIKENKLSMNEQIGNLSVEIKTVKKELNGNLGNEK